MSKMFKCDICGQPFEMDENIEDGYLLKQRTTEKADVKMGVYFADPRDEDTYFDVCPKCATELVLEAAEIAKVKMFAFRAEEKT